MVSTLYTHKISWTEYRPVLDMEVKTGFHTTKCALASHLKSLQNNSRVREIKVEVINQS